MNKKFRKTIYILIFLAVIAGLGYFAYFYKKSGNGRPLPSASGSAEITGVPGGFKTFRFDNFHGSADISPKFEFQYPADWHNEGQYFSPKKIQYYDMYSVKAPIYFDLILAEIYHLTEFSYQIDESKRVAPDATGEIDGKEFKKYDLIDYGSYGGDSAGRVKIFVGPKIKVDGAEYYLVFHWEEKPLAEYMEANDISVFDNILLSLKFVE